MTPERWTRIKDALSLALARPPDERAVVLDAACASEPALRREVEELLACQQEMGSFLAAPLLGELPDPTEDDDELPSELRSWTRYDIIERLGRGGMAVVYKARDSRLQRTVAIKVISGGGDLTVRRFLREAEAQARVNHEHVLQVYETGVIGAQHYIAMQYVNGPTLLGVRDETTLESKVELIRQIAEGLHEAHRLGLVHRDIKPGNILVERRAEGLKPYLLDFGLAADVGAPGLTQTGIVMGTPRYMPPERIQGDAAALDRRSDIYSLGATCYEFISGKAPFDGASGLQVLADILNREPPPLRSVQPSLAPEIDAIVTKCLEKDPHARYPSARALADDLRRYLDGDTVLARPVGTVGRMTKRARRHPRVAAAFGAMLAVIVMIAGWGAYGYWRANRQAELAQQLGQEIRDLDWLFRAAQMSPVHAIDDEKGLVRRRMARLEETMAGVGGLAFGPGRYALGRGFLTLGDAATALQHLDLAWEAGYRTADAAMALGLAHGEMFRVQMDKAKRIPTEGERTRRIRDLETAHRDRALEYLEAGRTSSIVPARYVEALIASHRGDVSAAIQNATEAARETPWLFEARLLPGHLTFKEAERLYISGHPEAASGRAGDADRYYAEAQRIAPSSIDASAGRCAVAGLLLHMAQHGLSVDPQPLHDRAEDACGRALTLEPLNPEAYRLYSDAVRAWAGVNVLAGRDPGDAYERAAALVARASELSGDSVETLLVLADTFLDRAWWERRTGQDPRAALGRAIATFEKVLAIDPRNATGANNIGQAFLLRSQFEAAQALNPLESLDRAVRSFQTAAKIDPSLAAPVRNLARAAIARAEEQTRRGIDPTAPLNQTRQFIEQLSGDPAHRDRVQAVNQLRTRAIR